MHDIDRTLTEFEPEMELEGDWELEGQDYPERSELESAYASEYEADPYAADEAEAALDEAEEMELAAELMEVADDAELEQFLGKALKRVGRRFRRFVRRPLLNPLMGILRGAARKALPMLGAAAGTAIGGPAGAYLGQGVSSRAGRLFGLELEGLSPEDQEFETARGFVRFAATAARNAALAPADVNPDAAAKTAAIAAAQQHAPGLLRPVKPLLLARSRRPGDGLRDGSRHRPDPGRDQVGADADE